MEDTSTEVLRKLAPNWSLAGDEKLLNILQTTHQGIITKCKQITDNLESMVSSLDDASISLQNVNNRFMALSSRQFIESRVYDDDVDLPTEVPPAQEPTGIPTIANDLQAIKDSLQILENAHETLTILNDSDTDTESEDDAPARTVLRPKDMYADRPLPYIIGSQAWKSKWHAGLVVSDSDSDSSVSARSRQQYSESEPELEPELEAEVAPQRAPHSTVSESSSEHPPEHEVAAEATVKQTPSDVAAELARRLGGPPPQVPQHQPESEPAPPTNKMIYKPEQPTTATIFPDEPPPLDSDSQEEDIFAELHRQQPYSKHQPVPDLFRFPGHPDTSGDHRTTDIFSDFTVKPMTDPSAKQPPFTDEPDMFSEPSETLGHCKDLTDDTKGIKKPVGGISLFGTNQGAKSIGAAILNRNRRKSSTSGEDSGSDAPDTPSRLEPQVKKEKDIFDDLFARSQKIEKGKDVKGKIKINDTKYIEKKNAPIVEKKADLFSDNIFDDIDDIFTTNVVKAPEKAKGSIFQEDDDLFAGVAAPKTMKSEVKNNLFDSDDELFSESSKNPEIKKNISNDNNNTTDANIVNNETTTPSSVFPKISNTSKTKKQVNDIFGDEDDLFTNINNENVQSINKNVTTLKTGSNRLSNAFKSPSLFDDEDDELFSTTSKPRNLIKNNTAVDETDQLLSNNIFDDDDGNNLFGGFVKPNDFIKCTTATSNETEPDISIKAKTPLAVDKNIDTLAAKAKISDIMPNRDMLKAGIDNNENTNWYKGVHTNKSEVVDSDIKDAFNNDSIANKLDDSDNFGDGPETTLKNNNNERTLTDVFNKKPDILTENIDSNQSYINKPESEIKNNSGVKPVIKEFLFGDKLNDDDELFKTPQLYNTMKPPKTGIETVASLSDEKLFTSLPKTIAAESNFDSLFTSQLDTDTAIPDKTVQADKDDNSIYSISTPKKSIKTSVTSDIDDAKCKNMEVDVANSKDLEISNENQTSGSHTETLEDVYKTIDTSSEDKKCFENATYSKKSEIDNESSKEDIETYLDTNQPIDTSKDRQETSTVGFNTKSTTENSTQQNKTMNIDGLTIDSSNDVDMEYGTTIDKDVVNTTEEDITPNLEINKNQSNSAAVTSVFDDIFKEPPAFEKPAEPKRSKNVNALFDDDSDDEALFFKKNDAITDEKPQDFKVSDDKFDIFFDEPPDDDISKIGSDDDFSTLAIPSLPMDKDQLSFNRSKDLDSFQTLLETVITDKQTANDDELFKPPESTPTPTVTKLIKKEIIAAGSMFSNDEEKMSALPSSDVKLNDIQSDDDDLFKIPKNLDKIESSETKSEESPNRVGKLKTMNFKINVNALLPGASPKKQKADDISTDSKDTDSKNSDSENADSKADSKLVKSVSFDGEPESKILDNKLSKERAKIQVKRRPSTRRARREAVRKSAIDFDDSTDNSSSIDDPPKILDNGKLVQVNKTTNDIDNSSVDNLKNDEQVNKHEVINPKVVENTTPNVQNENIKSDRITSVAEKEVESVGKSDKTQDTEYRSRDVKSKIVYILNDEDIFNSSSNTCSQDNKKKIINTNRDIDNKESKNVLGNIPELSQGAAVNKSPAVDKTQKPDHNRNPSVDTAATKNTESIIASGKNPEHNQTADLKKSPDDSKNQSLHAAKSENVKKSIFDSDSGDELFSSKREVKKMVKGPLFSDDDDDDLFGVKKKIKEPKTETSRSTAVREPTRSTQPVFEDPLSLFGEDD